VGKSARLPRSYDISRIAFHNDGQTVIKERIYLDKADLNMLYDEITVLDHGLTRSHLEKPRRRPAIQIPVRSGTQTSARKTTRMSASRTRTISAARTAS
jgi:hypothetical protein